MTDAGHRYRGRLRIRANGLLVDTQAEALLLVKIHSPVTGSAVWMPPGGGVEAGETMSTCLRREFQEETGLTVEVGALRHINELNSPPYHAVEFYFDVTRTGGTLELGHDPEHASEDQLLQELRFIAFEEFDRFEIAPSYLTDAFPEEYGGGSPTDISFSAAEN